MYIIFNHVPFFAAIVNHFPILWKVVRFIFPLFLLVETIFLYTGGHCFFHLYLFLPMEAVSLSSWKYFLSFFSIFGSGNHFFYIVKSIFMTYDLFLLADAIFLSSVKIFSFISRLAFDSGNHFFIKWKAFAITFHSFLLVETIFLSCGKLFLKIFIYSCKWKLLFYLTFILFYSIFSFQGKSFFAHSVYFC